MTDTICICKCNRAVSPPHCRACGSTNVYARQLSDRHERIDNQVIVIHGFRCRRCACVFDTAMPCEAPIRETRSMKEKRANDQLRDNLAEIERTKGRKAMLEFIARSQGLDPHAPVGDWRKPQPDNAGNSSDPVAFINSIPNEHKDASRSYTDDLSHGRDDNEVVVPPGGSVLDKE